MLSSCIKSYIMCDLQEYRSNVWVCIWPDSTGWGAKVFSYDYYYVNDKEDRVDSDKESAGALLNTESTHSKWILVGNKIGTDVSHKDNDHNWGQKFEMQKE